MNTLNDTLNDLIIDVMNGCKENGNFYTNNTQEIKYEIEAIKEEYLHRIINELNIKKYFKL